MKKLYSKGYLKKLLIIYYMSPKAFIEMLLCGVLQIVFSVLSVWCVKVVMSQMQSGVNGSLIYSSFIYGAVIVLVEMYSVWYKRYKIQFCEIQKYETLVRKKLFEKCDDISNECLEIPGINRTIRLADGARQNLFRFGEINISLVILVIETIIVTGYISALAAIYWLFLPFALIPPLVHFIKETYYVRKYHAYSETMKNEEELFVQSMVGSSACKETRTNKGLSMLMQKWQERRNNRAEIEKKQNRILFLIDILMAPLAFAGKAAGFCLSAILLAMGRVDFAGCMAAVSSYGVLSSTSSSFMSLVANYIQYSILIEPYFDYIDIQKRGGELSETFNSKITLEAVSFFYPNANIPAVDNVSLTINKGEKIAIVGINGAGKTTLLNLIAGLYLPTKGRILYDGIDISNVIEESLHKDQTIITQQFGRYKMSLGDNIMIGNSKEKDFDKARELQKEWMSNSKDISTFLGKEFGGEELSGGQWQQLSCARGFYKISDLIFVDEATSEIDPVREEHMLKLFEHELKEKTAIIICHRLASVSLADRIVVMDGGKISAIGTHSFLLKNNMIYQELWKRQTESFAEEGSKVCL